MHPDAKCLGPASSQANRKGWFLHAPLYLETTFDLVPGGAFEAAGNLSDIKKEAQEDNFDQFSDLPEDMKELLSCSNILRERKERRDKKKVATIEGDHQKGQTYRERQQTFHLKILDCWVPKKQ